MGVSFLDLSRGMRYSKLFSRWDPSKLLAQTAFRPVSISGVGMWWRYSVYFCSCLRDAFLQGRFDPAVAKTLIVLIPYVDNSSSFKELRPVSHCNVIHKLITKVLVNRLQPFRMVW